MNYLYGFTLTPDLVTRLNAAGVLSKTTLKEIRSGGCPEPTAGDWAYLLDFTAVDDLGDDGRSLCSASLYFFGVFFPNPLRAETHKPLYRQYAPWGGFLPVYDTGFLALTPEMLAEIQQAFSRLHKAYEAKLETLFAKYPGLRGFDFGDVGLWNLDIEFPKRKEEE
jgi:hypothetical protein